MSIKKIMLCTDFSENSDPARLMALEYARLFKASLSVIHVVDSLAGFAACGTGLPADIEDMVNRMAEAVREKLRTFADSFPPELGEVTTLWRVGVPAQEIVAAAEQESIDLIIIGTHGWTGVKALVLGSVAENVLRTATRPVMVVRAQRAKARTGA